MDKLLGYISLAKRAGKVTSGEFLVEKEIKQGKANLVIIARDASENAKKSIIDSCNFYNTTYIEYSDKENLAKAIGKEIRTVLSIADEGFSNAILKIYSNL